MSPPRNYSSPIAISSAKSSRKMVADAGSVANARKLSPNCISYTSSGSCSSTCAGRQVPPAGECAARSWASPEHGPLAVALRQLAGWGADAHARAHGDGGASLAGGRGALQQRLLWADLARRWCSALRSGCGRLLRMLRRCHTPNQYRLRSNRMGSQPSGVTVTSAEGSANTGPPPRGGRRASRSLCA